MTRSYSRWQCSVCGRTMSANGLARTNHCRKHVREGKMTEHKITFKYFPYSYIEFRAVRVAK